ncbi:MAG TPA: YjbH domain-containing protein [Thermohalobaculum sp.]|nr:YjbH domain-containing protein [Thermohalobaculum sp.]
MVRGIMRGRIGQLAVAAVTGVALACPVAAEEPVPAPQPNRNLFGMTGLIDLPSGEMQPDAEFGFTSSYFGGYLRNTISAQALPWLEVAFRYSVLEDMLATTADTTLYDRSFDVKLRLIQESPHWPSLVIGLQDFLGTGVYSGEYVAGTKSLFDGDLKVTAGIGWGRYAGANSINNPFCRNLNRFCDRTPSVGTGGSVDFGQFFSGEEVGLFGGLEWQSPINGLSFKAEYSGDTYTRERQLGDFQRKTGFNVGVEYKPVSGVEVGAYYMYGSEIGVRVSLSANPFRPLADIDGEPAPVPLATRRSPSPTAGAPKFGKILKLMDRKPVTTAFEDTGITDVTFPPREDGVRWAEAAMPASADYVCPDQAAKAIDAEYGVVDAVTFRHPDGTLVCTVALRPEGASAIRHATRITANYPTDWYEDEAQRTAAVEKLVAALEVDRLGLFGIELGPTRVTVYIENGKFRALPRAIGRTARALSATMPASVELFEVVPVENSLPVVSVVLERTALEDQAERPDAARAAWLMAKVSDAAPPDWGDTDLAMGNFPRMSWSVSPSLPLNLFDPDQPVRFDLAVVAEGTVEIVPGLSLSAAMQKQVVGNLDKIDPVNDSVLPRVRSDVARYLAEGDPALSRLTADYVTKLSPDTYGRLSAGLLERMYGGVSAEVLWKPADQSWGLGGEINWVQQRDFDQLFDFRDYDVVTGHASLYWDTGWYGLSAQLDAGRYLAGDWGATLGMKRRFANGWEFGGFFTLTDVPFSEFGEGSFDKGLFLTIPFNWFLPYESKSEFSTVLRPLTRDGGQRVVVENRLYPMVEDMDRAGLRDTWQGFWE